MKILAFGGGSGGHVTPVVAVLREIKSIHPQAIMQFWCDKNFIVQATNIISNFDKNISVQTIIAGKLRRYHHLSALRQLLWPSLVIKNIRDMFLVIIGIVQSFFKLLLWRPDIVFTKGGYVCLPVGIAAFLLKIPIIVHDSDAHPGLTNRILGKWAKAIATGAPLAHYSYPKYKTQYVGVPVAPEFHEFSDIERDAAKKRWGITSSRPLIVVTGGGLGASRINDAVVLALKDLLNLGSVVLVSGNMQFDELRLITPQNDENFQLYAFVSKDMALLLGAADVVVARAGATTILELAALAKPTILIPNSKLTGGHQLKNTAVYLKKNAVVALNEEEMVENPQALVKVVKEILTNHSQTNIMRKAFKSFARPNAASDVAKMIISNIK